MNERIEALKQRVVNPERVTSVKQAAEIMRMFKEGILECLSVMKAQEVYIEDLKSEIVTLKANPAYLVQPTEGALIETLRIDLKKAYDRLTEKTQNLERAGRRIKQLQDIIEEKDEQYAALLDAHRDFQLSVRTVTRTLETIRDEHCEEEDDSN